MSRIEPEECAPRDDQARRTRLGDPLGGQQENSEDAKGIDMGPSGLYRGVLRQLCAEAEYEDHDSDGPVAYGQTAQNGF